MLDFKKLKRNNYLRIIFILSIAYLPVLLCISSLKWDAMNISIPWRYFISATIRQGELPLWYPNQLFGMAQYLDPQTWYWPSWILGSFGYTNLTLHLEFMLHIFIAAIGCFKLGNYIGVKQKTAMVTGLLYAMSGFFIGNAQHIGWIVSAAWIPIVIYQFLLFIDRVNLKSTLGLSLSLYLFISGGYWSFVVITYYFLVIFYIYSIAKKIKYKQLNNNYLKKLLLFTPLLIITNIITTSVVFASLHESMHLIDRGNMDIDFTLIGSFHPIDLLTFLSPIATYARGYDFWETDVALINVYIGIFAVFLFIWSILFQRSSILKNKKLILLALFIFALAMGYTFPLRQWFTEYIPLFDHFRFPSAFRLYSILILCIVIGFVIDDINVHHVYYRKSMLTFAIILSSIGILIFITNSSSIVNFIKHFVPKPTKLPRPLLFSFQFILSALIIVLHYYVIKNTSLNKTKTILKKFIIIEIVFISLLTLPNTVINIKENPFKIYSTIKNYEHLDTDSLLVHLSMKQMDEYSKKTYPFGRNAATFTNLTSNTQYSSYKFILTKKLENDSLTFNYVSNNPLAYIPHENNINSPSRAINSIKITPNKIELNIEEGRDSVLCLSQNYHKNWKCEIEGRQTPIDISNISLMKVSIPNQQCSVLFSFDAPIITFFFWVSIIFFLIQVILFSTLLLKEK